MMYKDWFKSWFSSPHYLLLYQNRNEEEAKQFLHLVRKFIPIQKNWKVLDFCCGYGRLSKVFAQEGYKVTGIDLSEFLVEKAMQIFNNENLNGDFRICDVREFRIKEEFNLGISFFTSFGYFSDEENFLTFNNLCNSISKNGWIVLDYFNPSFTKNNFVEKEIFEFDHFEVLIDRKIDNNRVNKIISIKSRDNSEKFFESVRIYEFEDFKGMFEANGFTVSHVFGDYSGNLFNSNSPRMIIFSQKK